MMSGGQANDPFERELQAFEAMRGDLERDHEDRWVVIADGKLWRERSFDSFQAASNAARPVFRRREILIRKVERHPGEIATPASLMVGSYVGS